MISVRSLLRGKGCKACAEEERLERMQETVLAKIKKIHKDKNWSYELFHYESMQTKVCIICHDTDKHGVEHGPFWMTPGNFLKGHGCWRCTGNKKKTQAQFIAELEEIYGVGTYNYDKLIYINTDSPVTVICPKHGEFTVTAKRLLQGFGCAKCAKEVVQMESLEDFKRCTMEIHGDKYDYDGIKGYKDNKTKMPIRCKEHNFVFKMDAIHHVIRKQGCPKCRQSHMERETEAILRRMGVRYEYEKKFEWLGGLSLDFYLPECNVAIECQGEQHYRPIKHFGGEQKFRKQVRNDNLKKRLCTENKVCLYCVPYYKDMKTVIEEILSEIGIPHKQGGTDIYSQE